jgi:acetyl esterase/lipase
LTAPAEHAYGAHSSQVADLWLPSAPDGRLRVAAVIHGGFWRARYGRELMGALCRDLADRGWAAWNLEYRRLGLFAGGGWPATLDDVAIGIDHLAVVEAPLDLDRVAAVGHSAGGHLALWAAGRRRAGVPVRAAVGQAAVSDLVEAARRGLGGGAVRRLMGGGPDRRPERYAAASPAALLPLGVPQLLVHGARDDTVPADFSERYVERAGGEAELALMPEDGHFEHIDPASEAWRVARTWLEART